MKYIIMCGGRYDKWKTPRQLTKIRGEPVVSRTIRLLREAGVTDISISTNDERFDQCDVPILRHENNFRGYADRGTGGSWVEAFYPTDEPACYLLGDVVFSPEAIRTIAGTETNDIEFFASAPPFHRSYIKPHAEPFAFKVVDQKHFRDAVDFVRTHDDLFKRRPIAWELWQVINGENPNDINFRNYTVINDYTCDIDEPEDVEIIERVIT